MNVFSIVRKKSVSREFSSQTERILLSPIPNVIPNRFNTGINVGSCNMMSQSFISAYTKGIFFNY